MSMFNKLEFELFAPLSLTTQFPNIVNGLVKGESPDWQDEVNGIGIEVARAENRHVGYTNSISNKYLGKYREDIPTGVLNGFKGQFYWDDTERLIAISDSTGLVSGNRHIKLAISTAQKKLDLLNNSCFRRFNKNCLYMFITMSLTNEDSNKFLEEYLDLSRNYIYSFSDIFLMSLDYLFSINIADDQIIKHSLSGPEIKNLNMQVHSLCRASDWNAGTQFTSVYKSICNECSNHSN